MQQTTQQECIEEWEAFKVIYELTEGIKIRRTMIACGSCYKACFMEKEPDDLHGAPTCLTFNCPREATYIFPDDANIRDPPKPPRGRAGWIH